MPDGPSISAAWSPTARAVAAMVPWSVASVASIGSYALFHTMRSTPGRRI